MEHLDYTAGYRTVDDFRVYHLSAHTPNALGAPPTDIKTFNENPDVKPSDWLAAAEIVPELGNNCYLFKVADSDRWMDVIESPPDLATLKERPTAYGNPILFPFPNRIRGGTFTFEGETYQFDKTPESPTSIHGLLLNQPYQVESCTAGRDGAILVCSLDTRDFPEIGRQYPFPFKIQITYTLGPVSSTNGAPDSSTETSTLCLKMDVSITNTGERNTPMGFGIHPYFHALLAPDSDATQAMITVPVAKYWELDEALVPTGKTFPVSGPLDLRDGQPFANTELDHVFTDVQLTDGISRCIIDNRDTGRGMILESGAQFRELVVYKPPGRSSICFEPYTCPTDAINLEAKGIPAGVIVLSPDETFSATVRIIPIQRD